MKNIIKAAAITAVFIAVLYFLDFALYPCTFLRSDVHTVLTEQKDDIIFGASHGKMNISPETMQEVNGRTGHNLCIGGQYPIDSYYLLKLLIEKGKKPGRVIYALSPEYFMTEKEEGNNYILFFHEFPLSKAKLSYFADSISKCNFRTVLFPWYEYSLEYELSEMKETIRKKTEKDYSADSYESETQKYHSDGFVERYPVDPEKLSFGADLVFSKDKVKAVHVEYIEKMISMCADEGIEFVCVMPPLPAPTLKRYAEGYTEAQKFFKELFEKNGVRFVNFNDPEGELYKSFTHNVKAFTDLDGHMNGEAARAFSHLLAQVL